MTIRFDIPKKLQFELHRGTGGGGAAQGNALPAAAASVAASACTPAPEALSGTMTEITETEEA